MSAFQYMKNKISIFFREILWDDDQISSDQNIKRFLLSPLRIGVVVLQGFSRHECFTRATTLTYLTLLNMVPILAIALAILSFHASENASAIEKYLQDFFAPVGSVASSDGGSSVKANQFVQSIMSFVKNVNLKHISIYGYLFLLLSSISLVSSVEFSFNKIWGVKRGRSLLRKLGSYSIVLIILPFFVVISFSLSADYQTFALGKTTGIENVLNGFKGYFYFVDLMINVSSYAIHHLGVFISHLLQFLFAWLFFSLLYYYLPFTKVRFYYGLMGGLITAVLFEVAKPIFTGYIKYFLVSSSIAKIYGAISFVPFSLFWLYIVWIIILFGAELTYGFQNVKAYQSEFRLRRMNRKSKDLIVLKMVKEILVNQKVNRYFTIADLSNRLNIPFYFVESSISLLIQSSIIEEDKNTDLIKIIDMEITPAKVMLSLYNAGKFDTLELKIVSAELEMPINDWENLLLSKPSKFEI